MLEVKLLTDRTLNRNSLRKLVLDLKGCCGFTRSNSMYVASALLNMYGSCGCMASARRVFERIPDPDAVCWTALISGYATNGENKAALQLVETMSLRGCELDSRTLLVAVKSCSSLAQQEDRAEYVERAKQLHKRAVREGTLDMYLQNALIDMYAKSGNLAEASLLFESLCVPDVVSWNTLILGYAENGQGETALSLFTRMRSRGCVPNTVTFIAAMKACVYSQEAGLEHGRRLQLLAVEQRCDTNSYVQTTLIDMFSKLGSIKDAHRIFDVMKQPNVVAWTALIQGYAENGNGLTALDLFARMQSQGCVPHPVTFVGALKACVSLAASIAKAECKGRGKRIHALAIDANCDSDIVVQNTLMDMYAKCSSMEEAQAVFRGMQHPSVVSWTTLIVGFTNNGDGNAALDVFTRMRSQGCAPNSVTFSAVLKACSLLGALEIGKGLHEEIGVEAIDVMLQTCLVDFYAKCGSLGQSCDVFDRYPRARDVTTWNALLAGYSRLGDAKAALALLLGLQAAGLQINAVTFTCVLTACAHAGLADEGKHCFEAMAMQLGTPPNLEHHNCMLDILGRSNRLDDAMQLLRSMPHCPDAVTWLTVLAACRKWGNVGIGRLAFQALLASGSAYHRHGSKQQGVTMVQEELDVAAAAPAAAACVLMAHIYRSRGMWEEQDIVFMRMASRESRRIPGQSWWTNPAGGVHTFLAAEDV